MKMDMERDGVVLIVRVEGRLDAMTSPQFERELDANLDDVEELVVDLDQLEYLTSAGLRAILYAHKKMMSRGGMKVLNVNDVIMDIFEVTGFSQLLDFN